MSEYEQWYDGETYEWKTGETNALKIACCHCGLIHDIVFNKIKGSNKVKITIGENKRATATYRRHHKKELKCREK